MKIEELPIIDHLDKNRIEMVQKKQDEYKRIGSTRVCPGHTLFSFNRKTGEIKEAEMEYQVLVGLDGQPIRKREVKIHPDCFYDQALNKKNFEKHLKRAGII